MSHVPCASHVPARPDDAGLARPLAALGAAVTAAAGFAAARARGLALPGCPFQAITGTDCPGCGSTRCLVALARGDLWGALDHHVLVPLALVVLAWAWVAWVARAAGRSWWSPVRHPRAALVSGVLIGTFWVARLLPGPIGDYLAAAPR